MGLFDKLFGKEKEPTADIEKKASVVGSADIQTTSETKPQPSSKDIINMMVMMADMAMNNGDFAAAADHKAHAYNQHENEGNDFLHLGFSSFRIFYTTKIGPDRKAGAGLRYTL